MAKSGSARMAHLPPVCSGSYLHTDQGTVAHNDQGTAKGTKKAS